MVSNIFHQAQSIFSTRGKFTLIRENRKLITQFILTVLFIAIATWFVKKQQSEFGEVKMVLLSSQWQFIALGIIVTAIYVVLQGLMYKLAFSSVRKKMPLSATILLFLKRNFISIFIPAGGVTSLAFFTGDIEKRGVSKTKIHFASSIYAFVGILSVVSVAIPIFIYALLQGLSVHNEKRGHLP
jgi:phosphatidylglycerol lysyltransferase